MNTNPLTKGVVSENFKGIGTVTDEMVEKRAVELALINGRAAKDVSETDYAQAKRELTGERAFLRPALGPSRKIQERFMPRQSSFPPP